MTTITDHSTVGEIVAKDYRTASVFQSRDIDFCCNGNRTLKEACEHNHLDVETMLADLEQIMQEQRSDTLDFQSWPLDLLTDYIEKVHHRYIENTIPVLKECLEKVCQIHGQRHPELLDISDQFLAAAGELTSHMHQEEEVLFPYIRKLVQGSLGNQDVARPAFGTLAQQITMMMHDHDIEGERFRKISRLSDHYSVPVDACNTYMGTYALLKAFEEDLHRHIHLENNILFPKTLALEGTFA